MQNPRKKLYSNVVDSVVGYKPYSSANTKEGYRRSYPYTEVNGVRTFHRNLGHNDFTVAERTELNDFAATMGRKIRRALDKAGLNDVQVTVSWYLASFYYLKVVVTHDGGEG